MYSETTQILIVMACALFGFGAAELLRRSARARRASRRDPSPVPSPAAIGISLALLTAALVLHAAARQRAAAEPPPRTRRRAKTITVYPESPKRLNP